MKKESNFLIASRWLAQMAMSTFAGLGIYYGYIARGNSLNVSLTIGIIGAVTIMSLIEGWSRSGNK